MYGKSIPYDSFMFGHSIAVDENVWFIPYRANKIVYINKTNENINELEINDEVETDDSIRGLQYKYIFEYLRQERHIGIFSLKNNCILEIDTVEKKVKSVRYEFNIYDSQKLENLYSKNIFQESHPIDRMIYKSKILQGKYYL